MIRSPWLLPAVFVLLLASAGSIVISARSMAQRGGAVPFSSGRTP